MTARVFFVSKDMRFDVRPAATFGEPTFLFEGAPNAFALGKLSAEILEQLDAANFNENTDFVAMTGPTVALVTLFATIIGEYGRVRALIFDARNDSYRERVLKVPA
jgi:hypothetical protein